MHAGLPHSTSLLSEMVHGKTQHPPPAAKRVPRAMGDCVSNLVVAYGFRKKGVPGVCAGHCVVCIFLHMVVPFVVVTLRKKGRSVGFQCTYSIYRA